MKKNYILAIALILCLSLLCGCQGVGATLEKIEIPTAVTLKIGQTQTLTATFTPENAADKTVAWHSSDTTVATVDAGGVVTGVSGGMSSITAKTNDGGKTAVCQVTVLTSKLSLSGGAIESGVLIKGSGFPQDIMVKLMHSDGSVSDEAAVTESMTTGFDKNMTGIQSVSIAYKNMTASFDIVVADTVVESGASVAAAVASAKADDLIFIKAGAYAENFTMNKPLKLYGANAGVNPNNADFTPAQRKAETILTGVVTVTDRTGEIHFDGLKFERKKDSETESGAIVSNAGSKFISVTNCIADNPRVTNAFVAYFWATENTQSHVRIINNRITDATANGLTSGIAPGGTGPLYLARIHKIEVKNNYFSRSAQGSNDSGAAINLGSCGGKEIYIQNNAIQNLCVVLTNASRNSIDPGNIKSNVFTGAMRDGKTLFLEFNAERSVDQILSLIAANTGTEKAILYSVNGSSAVYETDGVSKSYLKLSDAVANAEENSTILVYSSNDANTRLNSAPTVDNLLIIVEKNATISGEGANGITGAGNWRWNGSVWSKA